MLCRLQANLPRDVPVPTTGAAIRAIAVYSANLPACLHEAELSGNFVNIGIADLTTP